MTGKHIRLEPLALSHAEDLWRHGDEETFRWFQAPPAFPPTVENMREYIALALRQANSEAYAVVLQETGEAVGSTRLFDIREEHGGAEIGHTWYGAAHRGTKVNPESKLLLLTEAFEARNYERVQFKTDLRNLRSQAGLAKLGAVREGVLRKQMRMHDGYMRDSVYFSILREEWPAVKALLLERLKD